MNIGNSINNKSTQLPEEVARDDEDEADAEDGHVGADHAQAVVHAATLLTEMWVMWVLKRSFPLNFVLP